MLFMIYKKIECKKLIKRVVLINKMSSTNNNVKSIYFKFARTTNTLYLNICANMTTTALIEYVKTETGRQDIELVKCGQHTDTCAAEDADAVIGICRTVYEEFGDDWNNNYLAFYIRIL